MVSTPVARKKMGLALSMFNTGCRNHMTENGGVFEGRLRPKSFWYEYSRRLLSEVLKGRTINEKTRSAVSTAKKGVPLSVEQRKKLSASLRRQIRFYAVSPTGDQHVGPDLRQFCIENGISYNTVTKLGLKGDSPYCITAGKNKGWLFCRGKIANPEIFRNECFQAAVKNRQQGVKSTWTDDRKSSQRQKTRTQVILQDPTGKLVTFDTLSSVVAIGPVSTIQLATIGKEIRIGKWSGWTRIS
jgi:hypothetical protein